MASRRGYFEDVGLSVATFTPIAPVRPITYVVDKTVDLSISHLPQVVLAKAKQAPIVAVGSLAPQPTSAMIWLKKSVIDGVAGLKGKTIAIPGLPFQKVLLASQLAQGGLTLADVNLRTAEYRLVPALINGRADAIFGGSWNLEGAELKARGFRPVIVPVQRAGVPRYDELVLVARRDWVRKNSATLRRLLAAVNRGVAAAIEDPRAAADAILEVDGKQSGRHSTEVELKATLPLLSRTGWIDPVGARHLVAWMHQEKIVRRELPASMMFTNRYLATEHWPR